MQQFSYLLGDGQGWYNKFFLLYLQKPLLYYLYLLCKQFLE